MNPNTAEVARPEKSKTRSPIPRIAIVVLLLLLVIVGAVPSYLQGKWSWAKPVPIENLGQLKSLTKTGLSLPGWKTVEQIATDVGGHKWSYQQIVPAEKSDSEKPIVLFLRPQSDAKTQPEVDWVDLKGVNKWKTDSYSTLKFTVDAPTGKVPVEASFFRGWTDSQTYAIAQWYAWPTGGSPAPANWFIADQAAQLRGQRRPWVAVNLQIPVEPLGDIAPVKSEMESLAKLVQATLIADTAKERK